MNSTSLNTQVRGPVLATPPSLIRDVVWGPFPSLGVSGPSLLQRPLSPLRAPARPHSASPPGPEEPRRHCQPPHPALRGTGPPVLSPRSRQGMSPSQVQGSTQQPVWPAPKEPPVVPHGLDERHPGGLCGGRMPAGRLEAPGSPGPACLCSQAFLPPPPPSFLMGPGVAPGERVCWYDGSGRGAVPPAQGQGRSALWPGLHHRSLQTS